MSTLDLYGDDQTIPFVVDVTESDADRIQMSLAALLLEAKNTSSDLRSNPTKHFHQYESYLDSVEDEILSIVGSLHLRVVKKRWVS